MTWPDNLSIATDAIRAHKLRAALTILGLTMGVATLMTVMTIVQGANVYVEQKIANLGTNVFRVARTPFAVVDFSVVAKALKNKTIRSEDLAADKENCVGCEQVGASATATLSLVAGDKQAEDASIIGYTPNMVDIDTRTLNQGRYYTDMEDSHAAYVCLAGASVVDKLFPSVNPIGKKIRAGSLEFTIIGTFDKLGSVLGQDQDNFVIVPLTTWLKIRGTRSSLTLEIKASGGEKQFEAAQDEVRAILRDFDEDKLADHVALFERTAREVVDRAPGAELEVEVRRQYRNMREYLRAVPLVVDAAEAAIAAEGVEPVRIPIRGGTDGSRLSEMGLPTPNIFAGGHEFHSVREWASLQDMAAAAATIIRLAEVWASPEWADRR